MSDKEKTPEELKPVEAELAALRPRRDRFDPQWRDFLAKAADLNAAPANAATNRPACSAPGDHLFLCVYCGVGQPRVSRVRRWAWPAAFSAMTAAAAVLLTMLSVQPEFQPVHHMAQKAKGDRTIFSAERRGQSPSPAQFTWASYSGPRWREERLCRLAATDPQSFDQALNEYFYRQPTWSATVATNHFQGKTAPTAQELMNEMLKRLN
jgi:hypothetical protein